MMETQKSKFYLYLGYFWTLVGALLAAMSIKMFLYPNHLIDGGVTGISLILGRLTAEKYIPLYLVLVNLPFIFFAYKFIRKSFVIHMLIAVLIFAGFLMLFEKAPPYYGDPIEIIVIGGAILGIGTGLVIRYGGCLDGSEILGIIANKKLGFTVGQVVLFFNVFVFAIYGLIFLDWHIAMQSLITFIVAFKMIDLVIVGLDEIKMVTVTSSQNDKISKIIVEELGLGLTITRGRGGYSGEDREILNIIVERLDLSDLKELILQIDPKAFITVTNVYEVVYGHAKSLKKVPRKKKRPQK